MIVLSGHDREMSQSNAPDDLRLPEGSSLDVALLRDVASVSNRAHQALGTRLLAVEGRAVVLAIEPSDLGSYRGPSGEWPNGVITSLLDHACAMAALIALDDPERFGGSLGLHVQYLQPSDGDSALHVRAECCHQDEVLVRTQAVVFHPDRTGHVVATGSATAAVAG